MNENDDKYIRDKLDQIYDQTRRTNGRVGVLEQRVTEHDRRNGQNEHDIADTQQRMRTVEMRLAWICGASAILGSIAGQLVKFVS